MAVWAYTYEWVSHTAQHHPERYGLEEDTRVQEAASKMPYYQQVLNGIYDNPFRLISAMGIPLAIKIFLDQNNKPHLNLSQKIMGSRVLAQGGVIAILLTTMAFRGYIDSHGRFEEPKDEA